MYRESERNDWESNNAQQELCHEYDVKEIQTSPELYRSSELTHHNVKHDDCNKKEMAIQEEKCINTRSLEEALQPFNIMRLPYNGSHDTIKSIDVDVIAKRIYAASWSEGVFVWDLYSHKPIALLRHQSWVNVLKCFPSETSESSLEEEYWEKEEKEKERKCQSSRSKEYKFANSPNIRYVLTGCEDGVLCAWNSTTFELQTRVKLSHHPINIIYIQQPSSQVSEKYYNTRSNTEQCKTICKASMTECNDTNTHASLLCDNIDNNNNNNNNNNIESNFSKSNRFGNVKSNFCYVAAMQHVYIMWVGTSFTPLHDLIHPGECLCITITNSSVASYLMVGQENGQIVCWNSDKWTYTDTLSFPENDNDITRDCLQTKSIHRPKLDVLSGQLRESFQYNVGRYEVYCSKENKQGEQLLPVNKFASTNHTVKIRNKMYLEQSEQQYHDVHHQPHESQQQQLLAECDVSEEKEKTSNTKLVEETIAESSNNNSCNKNNQEGNQVNFFDKWFNDFTKNSDYLTYDARRVTCLSSSTPVNSSFSNAYSGHANGVLLI